MQTDQQLSEKSCTVVRDAVDCPSVKPIRAVLKRWRSENKLTRDAIATAADVNVRTVSNWENGIGAPGIDQVRALEKLKPGLVEALGLGRAMR